MIVEGASLATEPPSEGFKRRGFEYARAFQNRTAEWARASDSEPVGVLRAPTGAGKTATFHEVIEQNALTLVVYPTNALLNQQAERFEEEGVNIARLSADSLSGHGDERVENLLQLTDRFAGHDIVVTNPDILQAVIQHMYRGATKPMQFFDRFDAVIYDEFHFYDDLAASGLLLQIQIFLDRRAGMDVLLASATPNESFVSFIDEELSVPTRDLSVEYDEGGDRFRQEVIVTRHEEASINDHREAVGMRLQELINEAEEMSEPQVALVFNSVAASNDFHTYLQEEFADVFEYTAKDNGFDTNDPDAQLEDETFFILNTTSKGEVGLDYDIRTLFMETPATPRSFLQRFGRAGRQHEATVHVYGLKEMSWPDRLDYPSFVETVYEGLGGGRTPAQDHATLRALIGLRAAYAIHTRIEDTEWFGEELREDFESATEYDKWAAFIRSVTTAVDGVGEFGHPVTNNSVTHKLLAFTEHCFEALRGLRGRSLSINVRYPRGDRLALTTYDLLTTLRYYDIDEITDNETIAVSRRESDQPVMISARFPGYENRPLNYGGSHREVRETFESWIRPEIAEADLGAADVSEGLLNHFYEAVDLPDVVQPVEVRHGQHVVYVDSDGGGPPSVRVERRRI
ncbi:type I-D CRISPR-associated helicase Cas3' [Halobacterium salinarum]|uniref:type I-D CRISPR-associated helicase Cas3' n=1 Tax=Halobacterium salinarum TaxID=2242 RepID=UPI001F33CC97|nr:type I-D CRISPR-associated helicase Cas3' [Halobacterium salinarum]MCF2206082.1 type I-D CRISPR-associated helicase Cas3' [Halobacterium salinarum]MCF2239972.1 type I-D CRISPR-associated helicase Cas3' [Halobacterium salinarum]